MNSLNWLPHGKDNRYEMGLLEGPLESGRTDKSSVGRPDIRDYFNSGDDHVLQSIYRALRSHSFLLSCTSLFSDPNQSR